MERPRLAQMRWQAKTMLPASYSLETQLQFRLRACKRDLTPPGPTLLPVRRLIWVEELKAGLQPEVSFCKMNAQQSGADTFRG